MCLLQFYTVLYCSQKHLFLVSSERETLTSSGRSVILQKSLNESLLKEAEEMRNKYDYLLKAYNNELQDYRYLYEKNCKGYQDLRKREIELKKLEIVKQILDGKIENLENSERQYMEIQKKRFTSTVVKFAEYYTLYHRNEKLKNLVKEKSKEEQELIKEHIRLTETVRQKNQYRTASNSIIKIQNSEAKEEATKGQKDVMVDRVRKFLDEEMLPCSLTSFDSSQRLINFNQDKSKVKILDTKIIPPPSPRPQNRKSDVDVAKKIETAMEMVKKHIARGGSFQMGLTKFKKPLMELEKSLVESKNSQTSSQPEKCESPRPQIKSAVEFSLQTPLPASEFKHSQPQIKSSSSQSKPEPKPSGSQFHQAKFQPKPATSQTILSGNNFKQNGLKIKPTALQPTSVGSQFQKLSEMQTKSTTLQKLTPITQTCSEQVANSEIQVQKNQTSGKNDINVNDTIEEQFQFSQGKVINSILKPSSQEKSENESKYFDPKKKTVSFQSQPKKEVSKFEMFSREGNLNKTPVVKTIFPKQFFSSNNISKQTVPSTENFKLPENSNEADNNAGYTMETGTTNFGTYGDISSDLTPDESFNFPGPFNPLFGQDAQEHEKTTFSFLSSQNKLNPFGL